MTGLSKREAALRWGVSRNRIDRAIERGELSLTSDKCLDPAELSRAFGEPKPPRNRLRTGSAEPDGAGSGPAPIGDESVALKVENESLKREMEHMRELVRRADAERDRALDMLRMLTHDRPAKPESVPDSRPAAPPRRKFLGLF